MTFDLITLGLVVFFAFLGALSGFSRQVAQAVATVVAFFAAGPLGRALTPVLAPTLGGSLTAGSVAGAIASFLVVYLVVRGVGTLMIKRFIAGKDEEGDARDRWLGAGLSGVKAGAMVYLGVCAMLFLERNVVVSGKRFEFTPKDSVVVGLARDANVLEWLQFPGTAELMRALKAASTPGEAKPPDALLKDPKFQALLKQKGVRDALASGDIRALLSNNDVVQFIRDPDTRSKLSQVER